jgi:DNA primase
MLGEVESTFERLHMSTPDHQVLQNVILRHAHEGADALREKIGEIAPGALEKLFAPSHIRIAPAIRHPDDAEMVLTCLTEELAKLEAIRGARAETDDAMHDIEAMADEGLTWRLSQAAEARNRAIRSEGEDKSVFDVGDNGALMDREERREFDTLLSKLSFSKPNRRG